MNTLGKDLALTSVSVMAFSVMTDVFTRKYLLDIYIRVYMVISKARIFHSNVVSKAFVDDLGSHRCHHSCDCIY